NPACPAPLAPCAERRQLPMARGRSGLAVLLLLRRAGFAQQAVLRRALRARLSAAAAAATARCRAAVRASRPERTRRDAAWGHGQVNRNQREQRIGPTPTPNPSPRRFAPGEGSRVSARRDDRCKEIEAS